MDPLGPHSTAILYSLRLRTDEQFLDRTGFSLWRAVHHRLQVRQLLLGEDVLPEQDEWLAKLNLNLLPLTLTSRVHEMLKATSAARRFIREPIRSAPPSMEHAQALVADGEALAARNEAFETDTAPAWIQNYLHDVSEDIYLEIPSIFHLTRIGKPSTQTFLSHTSWAFYFSNQIVHRESLREVMELLEDTGEAFDLASSSAVHRTTQQQRMLRLCEIVLAVGQQCVELLADSSSAITMSPQGRMTIVSSISLNMTVLLRSRTSSESQKRSARDMLAIMQLRTRL